MTIFPTPDSLKVPATVIVHNKSTMLCPVTLSTYKNDIKVPIAKGILNPNNGLRRYSEFFAAINYVVQYTIRKKNFFYVLLSELRRFQALNLGIGGGEIN